MSLVVNDTVKMEWESNRWLQSKGEKGKPGVFLFACKEYETDKGVIPVFFNAYVAWVHYDEEGTFSFDEVKANVTGADYDTAFPEMYAECKVILRLGETAEQADMRYVEQFGLQNVLDDIVARLDDLEPYGVEKDVPLS